MFNFFSRVLFIFGILIGFLLSLVTINLTKPKSNFQYSAGHPIFNNSVYKQWLESKNFKRTKLPFDTIRYSGQVIITEADYLFKDITILCVVLVEKAKNAEAAKNTWLKNCNEATFVDITNKTKREIFPIRKSKGSGTWIRLCKTLVNSAKHFKWILVVRDDTFALMENLRLLVAGLDHREHHYLGHAVRFWSVTYNMGQAGYVLSSGSLNLLRKTIGNADRCKGDLTYLHEEDMYVGKLLASVNITPSDTRDHLGLSRFHPHNWNNILFYGNSRYRISLYPVVCCSSYSITFQAIEAHKIYMYYYFIYQLQVFSHGTFGNQPAPTPVPEEEVWKSFLYGMGINETTKISSRTYYNIWKEVAKDPITFEEELKRKNDPRVL